jgi:hypothetical protein
MAGLKFSITHSSDEGSPLTESEQEHGSLPILRISHSDSILDLSNFDAIAGDAVGALAPCRA